MVTEPTSHEPHHGIDEAREFFKGPVLDLWNRIVPPEMTHAEVELLAKTLGPTSPPSRRHVLDVACGAGRHALALARHGFEVTGVDIAVTDLAHLAREAKAGRLPITTIDHDMRALAALAHVAPFDGAYCMGNAIAYLAPDEVRALMSTLFARLVPGARLVLDSAMVAESFLASFEEHIELEAGDVHLVIDNDYDVVSSRVVGTYVFTDKTGATTTRRFAHWCLTTRELIGHVTAAGFEVESMFDDTDGTPYELGSPRLILIAHRR